MALLSLSAGCPSDDEPSSPAADGGRSGSDAATPAKTDAGDSTKHDEDAAASTSGDAGPKDMVDSGGGKLPTSDSPCAYTVSDVASFPSGEVMYLCQVGSRVLQPNGQGDYALLMTASAFNEGSGDSAMIACSLSSPTPPKAGDTWTLGDAPGGCDFSFQHGSVAKLWKASSAPKLGAVTVTFKSATKMQGSTKPDDVYYLFELSYSATLEGQTAGAAEVKVTGTYTAKMLPLGA